MFRSICCGSIVALRPRRSDSVAQDQLASLFFASICQAGDSLRRRRAARRWRAASRNGERSGRADVHGLVGHLRCVTDISLSSSRTRTPPTSEAGATVTVLPIRSVHGHVTRSRTSPHAYPPSSVRESELWRPTGWASQHAQPESRLTSPRHANSRRCRTKPRRVACHQHPLHSRADREHVTVNVPA